MSNPIDEAVAKLREQIAALDAQKARLEQAVALLSGSTVDEVISTALNMVAVTAVQSKKPAHAKHLKWKPITSRAAPYAQTIYDLLATGKEFTSREVLGAVEGAGFKVPLQKVTNTLAHMKRTGRVVLNNKKWRRKGVRFTESTGTDAVAKLDALADEGKIERKVTQSGTKVYGLLSKRLS